MQRGVVVGHATATVKHPTMAGMRLLIVQPLGEQEKPDGEPVLAADRLGAGAGDRVIVTTDAILVREMVGGRGSPLRYTVMGIVDE
jgi:ethanolamine utilization protein EutN